MILALLGTALAGAQDLAGGFDDLGGGGAAPSMRAPTASERLREVERQLDEVLRLAAQESREGRKPVFAIGPHEAGPVLHRLMHDTLRREILVFSARRDFDRARELLPDLRDAARRAGAAVAAELRDLRRAHADGSGTAAAEGLGLAVLNNQVALAGRRFALDWDRPLLPDEVSEYVLRDGDLELVDPAAWRQDLDWRGLEPAHADALLERAAAALARGQARRAEVVADASHRHRHSIGAALAGVSIGWSEYRFDDAEAMARAREAQLRLRAALRELEAAYAVLEVGIPRDPRFLELRQARADLLVRSERAFLLRGLPGTAARRRYVMP